MGADRRCRFFEAASSQRATALSAPSGQRAELCPGHPECSEEHWGQVTGQPPFEMVEAPGVALRADRLLLYGTTTFERNVNDDARRMGFSGFTTTNCLLSSG